MEADRTHCSMFLPFLVKGIVVSGLLIAFIFQVKGTVEKYVEGKTVLVSDLSKNESLMLPTIALCPGFRDSAHVSFPGDVVPEDPETQSELVETLKNWHENTFDLADFIKEVSTVTATDEVASKWELNDLDRGVTNDIDISTFHSTFGRCYLLKCTRPLRGIDALYLSIKWGVVQNIVLFFFAPGDESGLFGNFWSARPATTELNQRSLNRDLPLTLTISESYPKKDQACNNSYGYSRSECSREWGANQMLMESKDKHCKDAKVCWLPLVEHFIPSGLIPNCTVQKDITCTVSKLTRVMNSLTSMKMTKCLKQCRIMSWSVNDIPEPKPIKQNKNSTQIYIVYGDTEHFVTTEYELFDLNAIVSAVGGSLGLFLGLSFYDCAIVLLNKAIKK